MELKSKRRVFFKEKANHEISESLRVIRTNLHFLDEKERGRTILVTSSTPREGKSFIAANYAMSIAITGKKVLLIDCDIRRPRAHESFGKKVEKGLESILLGEKNSRDVILKEVEKNLDVLPTKYIKSNVTELFLGDRMKRVIEELRDEYNTIVLDTPPLVVASDGAILSKYCDGVVFVVSYDQVSKSELEFSKKMLDNAGANLYGFVVNRVEKNGFSYGNYCYYNNNYTYYKDYYLDEERGQSRSKPKSKMEKYMEKLKKAYRRELSGNQKGKKY
ncbi:capsular exopolysaccharide family [Cetobacterium ceti]|uniref:non-specific protein-tyrosine kinase n=1 Tax=Cetobacterium ceti TaxID=180163 RepID=A0A1T4LVC1_9FUSO|nr:CpsD/CapB family tyrosine-protein kinase [Cetobacterium ceti]SJZ58635.1 capsular exopolysaccharide family [Cetobacterium ceti]